MRHRAKVIGYVPEDVSRLTMTELSFFEDEHRSTTPDKDSRLQDTRFGDKIICGGSLQIDNQSKSQFKSSAYCNPSSTDTKQPRIQPRKLLKSAKRW